MSFAIWCFLIGESDIFKVKIDPTDDVADLKQKIKGQKQALKEIDADHLTLHRVTINRPLETEALINELERLSETPQECTPLNLAIDVLSADIYNNPPTGKMHIILVRTPEVPTTTGSQHVRDRAVVAYIEEVVFYWDETGTDHFEKATLDRNDIYQQFTLSPNPVVEDIRRKLKKKRAISPKQLDHLKEYGFEANVIAEHFRVIDGSGDTCTHAEITDYFSLYIDRPKISELDSDAVKYKAATPFFRSIASYLCKYYVNKAVFKREGRWPLKFVAQVASERYSYEPRSDYLFSLDTCPRIDIELSSNAAQRDSYRMLLQAGLLVRVVNKLTGRNSFVAIAIYITMEMTAEWYFVYQPALGDKKIKYVKDGVFELEKPLGRFQFFHRLYNVPSALPDDGFSTIRDDLSTLRENVEAQKYKGFTTKPPKPKTRSNAPSSGSNTMDIDNLPTDQMFVNAKYQVLPEIKLAKGWAPLNKLPSTVRRARGPGDTRVILKIVEPDEVKIHSFLASIKSPDNHTIPILHEFPRDVGKLIAMPQETVLSDAPPQLFKTKGHLLARQFLEGVHFMHRHNVAHLDLKPDNIVVARPTNRLFIIDFSVSVQVSGPESRISGYRGTEGWAAPELELNSNREYQPIRADLWSAGRVLQYLADQQHGHISDPIYFLAERLMNRNPQLRPALSVIPDYPILEKEVVNVGGVRIVDPEDLNNDYSIPRQDLVAL